MYKTEAQQNIEAAMEKILALIDKGESKDPETGAVSNLLRDKVEKELAIDVLAAKAEEANAINHDGFVDQIEYLLGTFYHPDEKIKVLDDVLSVIIEENARSKNNAKESSV